MYACSRERAIVSEKHAVLTAGESWQFVATSEDLKLYLSPVLVTSGSTFQAGQVVTKCQQAKLYQGDLRPCVFVQGESH